MQSKITKNLMLIVLILATAIVPILVKVTLVNRTSLEIYYLGGPEKIVETFSFYKSRFIMLFGALLGLLFLNAASNFLIKGQVFDYKSFIKKPLNIAMALYILLLTLSTVFSPYTELALAGSNERYEGFFVLLSYCAFFCAAVYAVKTEKHAEYFLYGFFFSALIVGIVGTMQFLNRDPFKMEGFKNFILGDLVNALQNYDTVFPTVFSTLYNPNCAGMYGSMMFLLTGSLAALLPVKSPVKYIAALLTPLMLIVLVGSYSLAGVIGALVGVSAFILVCGVYLMTHRSNIKFAAIITTVILAAALAGFSQTSFFKTGLSSLMTKANWSIQAKDNVIYDYIRLKDNTAEISIRKNVLFVEYNKESNSVTIFDSDRNIIEPSDVTTSEDNTIKSTYSTSAIRNFTTELYNNVLVFNYVGTFPFGIYDNGNLTAISSSNLTFDINEPIPSIGFKDMQSFANSRGYIWSKSFPLLKNNIIIGKGPDTYTLQFPQHDVVGKTNFYNGDSFIIIDKPHNTYLQYAINTGVLSLLAILTVFGLYLVNTLVSVAKNKFDSFISPLQIGIFSGVSAYLVASLSSDSTVSVAPVFWCLLGLGFAINNIRLDANKETQNIKEVKNVKSNNFKRK